jgi:hypothetical protein
MPASSTELSKAVEEILEELEPLESIDKQRVLLAVAVLLGVKLP